MKKRALSLFLAVIMVVAMIPFSAINIFAETGEVTLSSTDTTATYSNLNDAIAAVEDGATIRILGTYTIPKDFVWQDCDKTVTITGGTFDASAKTSTFDVESGVIFDNCTTVFDNSCALYANGNTFIISETVTFRTDDNNKMNIIAGGGHGGRIIEGDTHMELYAGSFTYIFGSGYECTVKGDTHLTVGGNANSQYTVGNGWQPGIYGGGYKNGTGDIVEGSTYVTIKGNAKANHVVGGAAISGSQVKGDTHVTVEGGEIYRVIGGGRGVDANNTYVTVTGGSVRYIHGGSANANVTGDTHVTVSGTTNSVAGASNGACDPANHGAQNFRIFGGGFSENANYTNSVAGNTYVTVDGNIKANGVYGGGDEYSTGIGGTAHVNVKGGTFMTVYGGGYKSPVTNTAVTMTGGYTEQIFGGSESAAVTGNTILRVLSGTVSRRIYGGSYNNYTSNKLSWDSSYGVAGTSAVVLGSQANITLDYDDNDRSIYAGSRYKDNTVDNNEILAFLDAAAYETHGSKQGAQDSTMKLLTSSKKVADVVHTLKHTVSGNVITESCTVSGCNHSQTATITLDPKVSLNYAGKAITPAVIEYSDGWLGEEIGEITYENNNKVGTATASSTLARTGGTAVLSFDIVYNVIKVYNTKQGDGTVAFKDLLGTTLENYTTYKLMEDIDLGGHEQSTAYIKLANHVIFDGQGHSVTGFKLTGGVESALFNAQTGTSTATVTIQNITFGSESAPIVYNSYDGKYDNRVGYAIIRATDSNTVLTLNGVKAHVKGEYQCNQAWQEHAIFLGRNWGTVSFINCEANGTLKGHGFVASYIGSIKNNTPVLIENCVNNASIATDTSAYHAGFIALIDNASTNVTIKNSTNNGAVNGERYVGGFVAYSKGTLNISDCTNNGDVFGKKGGSVVGIGGIVGYIDGGTISVTDTTNNGRVLAKTTDDQCGGIVGYIKAANTGSKIQNCFNTGSIGNDGTTVAIYSGGIVAQTATSNVAIVSCTNIGSVTAKNIAGGIMATSSVDITVTDCTNKGTVNATTGERWWHGAGGIIGYTNTVAVTIQNCVNVGTVKGKSYVGGAMGSFNASKALTISGFVNSGTVDGTIVGGVIGNIQSVTTATISNSINSGKITGTNMTKTYESGTLYASVGGFLGNQAAGTVEISTSANLGAINGVYSGGFVGQFYSTAATNTITIKESRNMAAITTTTAGGCHAGGAIGNASATTGTVNITDFLNAGNVTSTSSAGGGVGIATADNANLTINITRLVNTGDIYGKWNTGAATGYIKKATLKLTNCVSYATITTSDSKADVFTKPDAVTQITATDNYYVKAANLNNASATQKTLAEALAILNNSANGYKFGPYTVNDAGNGIVLSTPEFKGYQIGKVNEETNEFKIRFLATIYDVELVNPNEYGCLGFEITINGELGYKSTQYVYNSITAKTDGTRKIYTASELGGKYVYAAIETLDATQDYTITVRTLAGKTTNVSDLYYGSVYTITIPASVAAK